MKNLLHLTILLAALCLLPACHEMTPGNGAANASLKSNSKSISIPTISFNELEQQLSQAQHTDSIYIYNFWATWCKPCVAELPYFEQLQAAYAHQKLKVHLVSLDFPAQLKDKVIPFVLKRQLQCDVMLLDAGNPNEWIDRISPDWTGSIPATLFIHQPNNYRELFEQSFTYQELEEIVQPLL